MVKLITALGFKTRYLNFMLLASLCSLVVILSACGGAPNDEAADESLTIYSGRSESLVGPIIQQFGETTGTRVLVKYAGTLQLAATLL